MYHIEKRQGLNRRHRDDSINSDVLIIVRTLFGVGFASTLWVDIH